MSVLSRILQYTLPSAFIEYVNVFSPSSTFLNHNADSRSLASLLTSINESTDEFVDAIDGEELGDDFGFEKYTIPHIRQQNDYDCGLACLSMVLSALGIPNTSPGELELLLQSSSIWTIDLAYLLQQFGVRDFTYFTNHVGVNFNYNEYPFYNADLVEDQKRVHKLFASAKDNNVNIVPTKLKLDDLRRFLYSEGRSFSWRSHHKQESGGVPLINTQEDDFYSMDPLLLGSGNNSSGISYTCILLVNAQLLKCRYCGSNGGSNSLRSAPWRSFRKMLSNCRRAVSDVFKRVFISMSTLARCMSRRRKPGLSTMPSTHINRQRYGANVGADAASSNDSKYQTECQEPIEYVGHYILMVEFDAESDVFYYLDPGCEDGLCSVGATQLDSARTSCGTDCDALVLKL